MRAVLRLMPLDVAEWRTAWSDEVLAFDSCDEGRGQADLQLASGEARRARPVCERSRYPRGYGGRYSRECALRRLCLFNGRDTVMIALGSWEGDWGEWLDFPEVPFGHVFDVSWGLSGQALWKFSLAAHIGEAQAGQECLEAAIGRRGVHCRRLGDNLGVELAMERKRAAACLGNGHMGC